MSKGDVRTLGRELRRARILAGLTMGQVAERSGVHPSVISRLERGETAPKLETARKLASALGVDLDQALAGKVFEPQPAADKQSRSERPQKTSDPLLDAFVALWHAVDTDARLATLGYIARLQREREDAEDGDTAGP